MKRCAANYENTRTFAGGKTRNSTDLPSFAKRFERCYEQNEDNYHNCNLNFAGKVTTKRSEVKWRQTFWSRSSWAGLGIKTIRCKCLWTCWPRFDLGGKSCGISINYLCQRTIIFHLILDLSKHLILRCMLSETGLFALSFRLIFCGIESLCNCSDLILV